MKNGLLSQTLKSRLAGLARGGPARLNLLCGLALAIGLGGLPRQAAAQCNLNFRSENYDFFGSTVFQTLISSAPSGDLLYTHCYRDINEGTALEYFLSAIDISNPNNPTVIGASPASPTPILSIQQTDSVALGTLFVGIQSGNIQIYEMADPNNPVALGLLDLPGTVKQLELGGNTLYALSGDRLDAVDISDPFNPASIGSIALTSARSLGAPRRDILPVTANNQLVLVDVSDPVNLSILDSVGGAGSAQPTIVGNAVVVSQGYAELYIFDISDPANIVQLPSFPDPNAEDPDNPQSSTLAGRASGFIYFGIPLQEQGVIYALDLTNPSAPVVVDEYNVSASDEGSGVHLVGSRLLTTSYFRYRLFNISSCATPPSIATHPFCQATNEGGAPVVLSTITSNGTAFEWTKDGQVVSDGPIYSGADTDTITIQPVVAASGTYELTVSNGDGEVTSLPAVVAVAPNAPAPTGGCAFSGDVCVVLNEIECQTASGTYLGDGTDCSAYVPDPTGACDFSGGECLVVTAASCQLVSGTYLGDDTDCSTNGPDITGGCTFAGEACAILTEAECLIADGAYLGDATDCSSLSPTITNITQGTTHSTLYDAIFSSNQNDVIEIGEGRLVEWGIVVGNRDVIIRGQGRDKTIIDAAYQGTFLQFHSANHSSIEDLTIRRGLGNALRFVGNVRPTLRRVDIRDCVGDSAVFNSSHQIVRFFGCRFINNFRDNGASAIVTGDGTSVKCVNCEFSGNAGGNQTIGSSADIFNLVNCTFADNTDDRAVSGFGFPSVQNCVFDGSNPVGSVNSSIPVEYSLLPGGTGTNIDGVPMFVDAANGDYRLAADSLGIDAADYDSYAGVVGGEGEFDVNGDERLYDDTEVVDTGVGSLTYLDMGAAEHRPITIEPDFCVGDMNADGAIDGIDTQLFVAALLEGATCP